MARSPFGHWRTDDLYSQTRIDRSVVGGRLSNAFGTTGLEIEVEGTPYSSDLGLAIQGKLQENIDAGLRSLEGAYWRAMNRVVEAGKGRLRADIVAGGFYKAQSLAKTWRGATYPKSKNSLEVAGWLTTKMGLIIDVFETGTVIRVSGGGKYLAIPLPPAKAIIRRLARQKQTGSRMDGTGRDAWGKWTKDDSYVAQVAQSLNTDLVPIINHATGKGVLVAANDVTLTRTGREAKNQNRKPTPVFALTKVATLRKRIRGRALLDEIRNMFPADFAQALAGELSAANRNEG